MQATVDKVNVDGTVDVVLQNGDLYRNLNVNTVRVTKGDIVEVDPRAQVVVFKV